MFLRKFIVILLLFTCLNSFGQHFSKMPPGFDNTVRCVTYDSINNLFYAGGNFHYYGFPYQPNNPINKIAVWNGSQWDSLGSGVTQPGFLLDLLMYNGNLLAAGNYNEIGGIPAKGIGLWNGTSWQHFADLYDSSASSYDGKVNVIKLLDNDLYVGGGFNRVNGVIADGVAKFDGATWSVYPYISQYTNISDIAIYNNELYVAGNFSNGNGTIVDIAKFDGINWVSVGGWTAGFADWIFGLEVFQGKLIVAGQFSNASGAVGNNIAAWDGNSWSTLQSGLNYGATSMKVRDSLLYVAGIFTVAGGQSAYRIATWNGNNWSSVGMNDSLNNGLSDFTFGNNTLYVGGGFTKINGDTINFIAKMDLSTSLFENINSYDYLDLYPNPNNGIFTIDLTTFNSENIQFEILNYLGISIFSGISSNEKLTINSRELNLPSGFYFFRLKDENKTICSKFIVNLD